jgi:hypothetical protein
MEFVEWNSVLYYWLKEEIVLVITVRCPKCNNEARMEWRGKPYGKEVVYPNFGGACWCGKCKRLIAAKVSKKSVIKWIQLAKIQMKHDWIEMTRKPHIKFRSEKKKQRRKKQKYMRATIEGAENFAA